MVKSLCQSVFKRNLKLKIRSQYEKMSAPYFISEYDILVAALVPTGIIILTVAFGLMCCYCGNCQTVISVSRDVDKVIPYVSENSESSDDNTSKSSIVSPADQL